MDEYISRKAAIGMLKAMSENADCGCAARMFDRVKKRLEAMPAADVEPVVRCEECAYHEDEEPGMVYCPRILGGWVPNEFFCGEGKRRTKMRTNANEPDRA